jgi:hypothetical protein
MANVVNVLHITAEAEKYRDASFPNPVKRLMIGQLAIFTKIIKRIIKYIAWFVMSRLGSPIKGTNLF